ncbi:DUF4172 domain-containing protein [Algibacter wandonensis]|nr:DUF4172 domain-containing protein [Algibacter lectus]
MNTLEDKLYAFIEKSGRISGILKAMTREDHLQAMINIMVAKAIKTSEIEGDGRSTSYQINF